MAKEMELRLLVDPAVSSDILTCLQGRADCVSPPVRQSQLSVYYDAPDLRLMKAQMALRVREVGERRIQTIKTQNTLDNNGWVRDEWEWDIDGVRPDFSKIDQPDLADLFASDLAPLLEPVFRTEIDRTILVIDKEGAKIELALDQGRIVSGDKSSVVSEIELELKSGDERQVFALALELLELAPLRLSGTTKSQRGYLMAQRLVLAPQTPFIEEAPGELAAGEAFQRLFRATLTHIVANIDCLAETKNSEALHQIRTGLRRMSILLSLFDDAFAEEKAASLKSGVKAALDALAPARQIDVFMQAGLDPLFSFLGEDRGFSALCDDFARQWREELDAARQKLDAPEFSKSLLSLAAWIEGGFSARSGQDLALPFAPIAAKAVKKSRKRLIGALKRFAEADQDRRHEIRVLIRAYLAKLAFFRSAVGATSIPPALVALEETLGRLDDSAKNNMRICDYAQQAKDKKRVRAAGVLLGWNWRQQELWLKECVRIAEKARDALRR